VGTGPEKLNDCLWSAVEGDEGMEEENPKPEEVTSREMKDTHLPRAGGDPPPRTGRGTMKTRTSHGKGRPSITLRIRST